MKAVRFTATLLACSALTGIVLWHHGYRAIFEPQLQTTAGALVLVDLGMALSLFLLWMWRDARAIGCNPWLSPPWDMGTSDASA